jgi:hypothetical protein
MTSFHFEEGNYMGTSKENVTRIQSLFVSAVERRIYERYDTGAIDDQEFNELITDMRSFETSTEKFLNLFDGDIPTIVEIGILKNNN